MKSIIKLISFFLGVYMIVIAVVILGMLYILYFGNEGNNIIIGDLNLKVTELAISSKIILTSLLLVFASLILWAILQFQKVLSEFEKNQFFSPRVVGGLKKSGYGVIILALFTKIAKIIYQLINENAFKLSIGDLSFNLILLGLCLLVFSTVFKRAKELQEENQLTI